MADKSELAGLAAYLGKYADQIVFDGTPVVRSDEYSLASFFKVRVPTQDGPVMQRVKLGPTELYSYPGGDQSKPAEFKGILDEMGRFIPCQKNEEGDFVIPTIDGQSQIVASAENLAKRDKLSRTVYKMNYLERKTVYQSEERVVNPEGRPYEESEAYTVTHMSNDQIFGPIEYYTYGKDRKPEFVGILATDGYVIPCDRNADGDFEFIDPNREKHVVPSAETELKDDPKKPYKIFRTEYYKGQPIFQQMTEDHTVEQEKEFFIRTQPTPEDVLSTPMHKGMQNQIIQGHQSDPRSQPMSEQEVIEGSKSSTGTILTPSISAEKRKEIEEKLRVERMKAQKQDPR